MMKKIKVGSGDKKLTINVRELSYLGMARGLMFRGRNCDNLLFDFKKEGRFAIHSWFVFFPFLALWLDEKNKVVEKKIVKPFCFHIRPKNKFRKLIEVPLNRENTDVISRFSDGERFKYNNV